MTDNTTDTGTETTRYATEFDTAELTKGDRIAPELVARYKDQLNQPIRCMTPDEENRPDTQLVTITELRDFDDVHSAILFDPKTGVYARASCNDTQSAWSQKEADWEVHDAGDTISVTDARVKGPSEPYAELTDERGWVAAWAEVILMNPFKGAEKRRIHSGNILRLHDPHDDSVAFADVQFGWDNK